MEVNQRDPRSLEPWWNDECEETYQLECKARMRFEKEASLETSKAFKKLRAQLKRRIAYAQRCYAHKMHMAEAYNREYPIAEENMKIQEEVVTQDKKKKKKKKAGKDDVGTESDGDNLDLSQEMYPLSDYASNHEELVTQMFLSIRGAKLEAMLPPILKSIPLHELKSLCLHELRGMSKKRIICTITGQVMEGSSESEEEEETEKNHVNSADCNENSTTPSKGTVADENRNNNSPGNQQGLPAYLMKTIKVEDQDVDGSAEKNPSGGKSVLELLELQMRARIIKTMLEKGDDDGKPLTEDAIAALMGTATQSVQDNDVISAVKLEKDADVSEVKGNKEQTKDESGKDVERTRKSGEGRQHRDDGSKHGRSSHKREHHRRRGSKRQRNAEARDTDEDNEKKLRRGRSLEKRSPKKKKITRREFEERMKRAKKNRTYRQRKSSEGEEKTNVSKEEDNSSKGDQPESEGKAMENIVKNSDKSFDGEAVSQKEGEAQSEKEEGEAVSEKEEGELDSDEEEEGACSPSDISSVSYYSSSRSYTSRSRSRSYSRSWSRSPVRKKGGHHSRGRSRSWTRSRSRSRSIERRKKDSSRWSKKSTRDHGSSGSVKMSSGVVSLPSSGNQKPPKEEEDNWGQSCDIEFVDSEEDFDDSAADANKNTVLNTKKPLPIKGQNTDRASISFSFQKKTVTNINPNVDLDDLPLKSSSQSISEERKKFSYVEIIDQKQEAQQPEDIIDVDSPKMISDEILISSDSEHEIKEPVKTKSVRVEKRGLTNLLKDGKRVTKKDASVNDKTCNSVKSNVISNPVTSQESDVKKDNKLANQCESKVEADQVSDSKCDKDEKQNQNENTGVSVVIPIDIAESDSIKADENQEQEKTLTNTDNKGDGGNVQAIGINDCKTMEEIQKNDNRKEGQITDEGIVSTGTPSTRDGDVDGITQRSKVCLDAGKESTKTSLPKEDLHGDPETKVASALLPKLDEVKVDITGHESQSMQRSRIEAEGSSHKNEESVVIISENKTKAEKEDPSITVPNEKHTLDDSRKLKSHTEEAKKSCKTKNQKVVLEHLQYSYNEEQDNNITDSSDKSKEISTSNRGVHSDNPECSQKVSVEEKEVPEESAVVGAEQPNKTHPEEKLPEAQQEAVRGEEHNAQKSEEQLDDIQENNANKSQGSAEDFYRGVDQLTFSDDDVGNSDKLDEELIPDDREVEPIRINTGLIRRVVTRSRKKEMGAPEKSWTKKEKKKKDKPTDVLVMEGIGLLRKSLAESAQSPSSKEEEESQKVQDPNEGRGVDDQGNDEDTSTSWGISSVSSREETSIDSRVQSPKESTVQAVDTSPVSGNDDSFELRENEGDQKKTGQKTEIIGVIETSSNPDVNQIDDMDLGGVSWSMRWLQSEKVQKVVSSSKMLSRVRKKIQKKDKATKVVPSTEKPVIVPKKVPEPVVSIIGSIEEYERLFGMKAKKSADEATSPSKELAEASISPGESAEQACASTQNTQPPQKKSATFGSDDEGEDSEEEALWSKILGK